MKKNIIFFTIFVIILLIIYEFTFNKNLILKSLFDYLIVNKNNYFLIITVNFLYFLTPLPVTPIILFNGFFYGFFGFLISYPIIIFDSVLMFFSSKILVKSKLFKFFFKKNIYKDYRVVKISKASSSNYIFILSRYIFPYFMHNLIYGILNISWKKFLYLIVLSEIPLTYAFIMLGNSLSNFMYQEINVIEIFYSQNFLLPLSIILIFMIVIKIFKKKF